MSVSLAENLSTVINIGSGCRNRTSLSQPMKLEKQPCLISAIKNRFQELTDKLICQPESRSKRRRKTSIVANQQVKYPSHISWGMNLYIRKRKGRLTIKEHLYPFPVKTEVFGINTAQSIETVLLFRSGKGAALTPPRIRNSDTDIPVFISVMQRIPQLELVLRSFFTNRLTTL